MNRYDLESSTIRQREVTSDQSESTSRRSRAPIWWSRYYRSEFRLSIGSSLFYRAGDYCECPLLLNIEHVLARYNANNSPVFLNEQRR